MLAYLIIVREGAMVVSMVTYLNPIVAIVLGVLVRSENITLTIGAGIALVLVGRALARYRGRPASEP